MGARTAALAALAIGTAALSACEPPPPPVVLEVNSTALDDLDADPGDGVCETAPGNGVCTLGAAVDEASAHLRGEIVVPAGTYLGSSIYTYRELTVRAASSEPNQAPVLQDADAFVAAGATLRLQGLDLSGNSHLDVRGSLFGERISVTNGNSAGAVVVAEGGGTHLRNSFLSTTSPGIRTIRTAGAALLDYSTIVAIRGAVAVDTAPTGRTILQATAIITLEAGSTSCAGTAPESLGRNLASDATCSLAGPGDVVADEDDLFPPPGSVRRDAVPVGTNGCGGNPHDIRGFARPTDGNGDGVAACDTGAWEA